MAPRDDVLGELCRRFAVDLEELLRRKIAPAATARPRVRDRRLRRAPQEAGSAAQTPVAPEQKSAAPLLEAERPAHARRLLNLERAAMVDERPPTNTFEGNLHDTGDDYDPELEQW